MLNSQNLSEAEAIALADNLAYLEEISGASTPSHSRNLDDNTQSFYSTKSGFDFRADLILSGPAHTLATYGVTGDISLEARLVASPETEKRMLRSPALTFAAKTELVSVKVRNNISPTLNAVTLATFKAMMGDVKSFVKSAGR